MKASSLCVMCDDRPRKQHKTMCEPCHSFYAKVHRANGLRQELSSVEVMTDYGPRAGVYFLRCGEFIKIGKAFDVLKRYATLYASNPYPLEPLGFVPVTGLDDLHSEEYALQRRFHSHRHRGEWFHAHEEIVAYIKQAAAPWPKAVSAQPVAVLEAS